VVDSINYVNQGTNRALRVSVTCIVDTCSCLDGSQVDDLIIAILRCLQNRRQLCAHLKNGNLQRGLLLCTTPFKVFSVTYYKAIIFLDGNVIGGRIEDCLSVEAVT
jgi:hypothetical protein